MLMLSRTAWYVAAGALIAALATVPAAADARADERADKWAAGQADDWTHERAGMQQSVAGHPRRNTEGRVTARAGLKLRDKPTRASRIIRVEPYGATVHIFCKSRGDHVEGNDHWYLLTDGTWAWGSAQYIVPKNGHTPRWC